MSKFFINRPIVAIVISILMVLVGIVALLGLPTAQFPNIADPMIQVKATYPGADAQTIAESVATPIEQQMSGVSGMSYMYSLSASSGGGMSLYVDFTLGTDVNTDQILAQMRNRFRLLAGGTSRHHETLEAAIDGSWELLRPWERAAWAQCSVFEGGFTLEAAEGVLDLGPWPDAPAIVAIMQSLVDKNLLRVQAREVVNAGRQIRFGLYVTLQEYARSKLAERDAAHEQQLGRTVAGGAGR